MTEKQAPKRRPDHLHGALELLILKLLEAESMNGYGVGVRLQNLTNDALRVEEGSLYPALYRMERRGWLKAAWRQTENKRRAKYYSLTSSGHKQLSAELAAWSTFSEAVTSVLGKT